MPKDAREYSVGQEKTFAKGIGAKQTSSSGRFDTKGDSRIKGIVRFDNKATQKKSYSIKLDDLQKLEKQCYLSGEEVVFQLDFLSPSCRPIGSYAIITTKHYQELLECYIETNNKD